MSSVVNHREFANMRAKSSDRNYGDPKLSNERRSCEHEFLVRHSGKQNQILLFVLQSLTPRPPRRVGHDYSCRTWHCPCLFTGAAAPKPPGFRSLPRPSSPSLSLGGNKFRQIKSVSLVTRTAQCSFVGCSLDSRSTTILPNCVPFPITICH